MLSDETFFFKDNNDESEMIFYLGVRKNF